MQIEVTPEIFSDRVGAMESLQSKLAHEIVRALGIRVAVHLVEPHTIERGQGKRVIDKRGP